MKRSGMNGLTLTLLLSLHVASTAQRIVSDSSQGTAFHKAVAFYNSSFAPSLDLFTGREYLDYNLRFFEGHPYFLRDGWTRGTITYQGNTYEDVSLLYNLETDNIIISDYSGVLKIQLLKEKVSSFSLEGHSFIHVRPDSLLASPLRTGFYEVLIAGKLTLLARRTKNIQTYTKETVEIKVFSKDLFYLGENKVYAPVGSKKSLLKRLPGKRKEINQFIKQNRIRYFENPENAMVRIVEYYNQISN